MIFLLCDIFFSITTKIPTFFFLINVLRCKKDKIGYLIVISLLIDLFVLNTYFLNTIIILGIYFLINKIKLNKRTFYSFIILISLIYFGYILSIGLINRYSIYYILKFGINNYLYNLVFYVLCYKLENNYI